VLTKRYPYPGIFANFWHMLHGRSAETARIDELLAAARDGRSGALVIRGEAGVGKTALLDYAAAAAGMRVLRGTGIESETELPFAALQLLLRPGLGRLDVLPPPQAQALRGAFGLAARTRCHFRLRLCCFSFSARLVVILIPAFIATEARPRPFFVAGVAFATLKEWLAAFVADPRSRSLRYHLRSVINQCSSGGTRLNMQHNRMIRKK